MHRSWLTVLHAVFLASVAGCGTPTSPPADGKQLGEKQAPSPPVSAATAGTSLGRLDFPVTGSDECQRNFTEGMLALHSFLYDQAQLSFAAALAADPRCAMAAWGEAMAHDRAIWSHRDLTKGRAALAKVTHEHELTAKERAHLTVARALYEKAPLKEAHAAWLAAAAGMHSDYPEDDEVSLQYALSLLSLYADDPAHLRERMEAGSLALQVLARNSEHPGAAHYVIHAFDSREHAVLALPAARIYARIAPAASHALHMPSHTFTHLGMWAEVVPSNERAYAASVAWHKGVGHTPSEYDWHAQSWLVAAHVELGQHAIARKLTDEARVLLVAAQDDSSELRLDYVSMVGNYVTQTGSWAELEGMIAPVFARAFDEGSAQGQVACAMHAPGGDGSSRGPSVLYARFDAHILRAEAAIRFSDRATAIKRVADIKAVAAQMAPWQETFPTDRQARWDALTDTLLLRAQAAATPSTMTRQKAIEALGRRQQIEAAFGSAGPDMSHTLHELLGETLLAAGKPKEALTHFEQDLDQRPNRAIALLGAARAAKAADEAERSRQHYATLAQLWKHADEDLPELVEVALGAK